VNVLSVPIPDTNSLSANFTRRDGGKIPNRNFKAHIILVNITGKMDINTLSKFSVE
jgi:hypothetical protein